MRHDGARGLPLFVGDLIEARNIRIGLLLLIVDQMAVRAKLLCQLLMKRIGLARHRGGKCQARDDQHGTGHYKYGARGHGSSLP